MSTAERLCSSVQIEGHGIFALLWDAKEDLVRALLVANSVWRDAPRTSLLLDPNESSIGLLRKLIESRVKIAPSERDASNLQGGVLWFLFLQQASSNIVGPLLNGWRGAIRGEPGTILV